MLVIPVRAGRYNIGQRTDLLIVGAYPDGDDYDILRGNAAESRPRSAPSPPQVSSLRSWSRWCISARALDG